MALKGILDSHIDDGTTKRIVVVVPSNTVGLCLERSQAAPIIIIIIIIIIISRFSINSKKPNNNFEMSNCLANTMDQIACSHQNARYPNR